MITTQQTTLTWQPIETAPSNTVVLTDRGTARYITRDNWEWGCVFDDWLGWYLCESDGYIYCRDEENARPLTKLEPRYWTHLPIAPI